jgi:hypothetical protein
MNIVTEAIKAVIEINDDVESIEGLSEEFYFSAETDGVNVNIKFLGSVLWSSEDDFDLREFNEHKNEWEPLIVFLRRERDKLIQNIKLYEGASKPEVLYAAGFRDTTEKECLSMGMFGGPTPDLQSLMDQEPPLNDCGFPAYIVKLDKNDTIPIAKWNGIKWVERK